MTITKDVASRTRLPGHKIGEGDSYVVYDFIPLMKSNLFSAVKNEVHWQKMLHARGEVPRLVCAQGVFGQDGSMPVYRHPSDQSLPLLHLSPKIQAIKREVEKVVGHSMNHVLIQLYRNGEDYISEHSDKTLDIVHRSTIVNVSLGAQRTMRLRTKKPFKAEQVDPQGKSMRQTQNVPLPHGSMFVLGLRTNMCWLHSIHHDKRPISEKSDTETAFGGERISLTFRNIGTHLDSKSEKIWGQGASAKFQVLAETVVNGNSEITQEIIDAFGHENQQTAFDWNAVYGKGFDVLHFRAAPDETPIFFLSGNLVRDLKVKIFLEEIGLNYRIDGVSHNETGMGYSPEPCFRDTDTQKTQVFGDVPILLYLSRIQPQSMLEKPLIAEAYSQLWALRNIVSNETPHTSLLKLDEVLDGRQFLAGSAVSISDCAYWPIVDEILKTWVPWNPLNFPHVAAYHEVVLSHPSVKRAFTK